MRPYLAVIKDSFREALASLGGQEAVSAAGCTE